VPGYLLQGEGKSGEIGGNEEDRTVGKDSDRVSGDDPIPIGGHRSRAIRYISLDLGINQGGHIARGVNQLACNIFTEPVGFQRGEETSKPISGLDWFSKRLMALQGE
jgi:hypothetical protein